jgi:hypothetical protein
MSGCSALRVCDTAVLQDMRQYLHCRVSIQRRSYKCEACLGRIIILLSSLCRSDCIAVFVRPHVRILQLDTQSMRNNTPGGRQMRSKYLTFVDITFARPELVEIVS